MNIIMLLSNPFRPDPRVLKEAESLSGLGYSVTVICWDRAKEYPEREITTAGTSIIRIQSIQSTYGAGSSQSLKLVGFWRKVFGILPQLQPDIIHCHDFDTLPAGLAWGKLNHTPVIYDAHEYYAEMVKPRLHGLMGRIFFKLIQQAERAGASLANAVITVDDNLAGIYRKLNNNVLIVGHYPPVDSASLPHAALPGKEIRLVYAGRISTDRGMLIYIDILKELAMRSIPARLVLAGVFSPLKEQETMKEYAGALLEKVDFVGWIPFNQMSDYLRQADVGLVILLPEPRFVAAVPVKLFEYMAAGLPVIGNDFPFTANIIHDNKCGVTVTPETAAQSAASLLEEWWVDWSTPAQMGENGRQVVLKKYNWEMLVERIDGLYKKLPLKARH